MNATKIKRRTLKEDRELCEKLAAKLGHELGPWRWWFGQRRGICSCKLCGDWAGVTQSRKWLYDPDWNWKSHNSGIVGTTIIDNSKWRMSRCWGISHRAKERAEWTKAFNKTLAIIKGQTPEQAAREIVGDQP